MGGSTMTLLDDIHVFTNAPTIEDVWTHLTKRLSDFGFDRLIYGFTRFKTARSFGDPLDLLILTNHNPSYTDHFIGEAMYFHAPMVRWSVENVGACSWGWISENLENFTPSEMKIIAFNQKHGVVAGYSVSFPHVSLRERGAIALTAKSGMSQQQADDVWEAHGAEILALTNIAHLKIMALPHMGSRRALTKRQREVLEWVGDGKTMQDIGIIMGLTPATIEKHLRLAREALDVDTTAQAVMKASLQNQFFLIEP